MNCTVCNKETRNIELDIIYAGGVPIETPLCLDCVEIMRNERMNEIWSFNGDAIHDAACLTAKELHDGEVEGHRMLNERDLVV